MISLHSRSDSMKRILVVEDDEAIKNIIVEILKSEDYHVDSANDGLEGMIMFVEQDYDLIISDIMMPYMDGYDFIRRIKEENKYVNVIVLSALGEEYDELKGFDLGVDDYVSKPFSTKLFKKRVEAILRNQDNNKVKDELLNIFKE